MARQSTASHASAAIHALYAQSGAICRGIICSLPLRNLGFNGNLLLHLGGAELRHELPRLIVTRRLGAMERATNDWHGKHDERKAHKRPYKLCVVAPRPDQPLGCSLRTKRCQRDAKLRPNHHEHDKVVQHKVWQPSSTAPFGPKFDSSGLERSS